MGCHSLWEHYTMYRTRPFITPAVDNHRSCAVVVERADDTSQCQQWVRVLRHSSVNPRCILEVCDLSRQFLQRNIQNIYIYILYMYLFFFICLLVRRRRKIALYGHYNYIRLASKIVHMK